MNNTEASLLIADIINKALEGKAFPFRTILYWSEYWYFRRWSRSTTIVIKTLRASACSLFKKYCNEVIAGISDVTKLLAYNQLLEIIAFYENDLNTIRQMLDDYEDYLNSGNFLEAFFGNRRMS